MKNKWKLPSLLQLLLCLSVVCSSALLVQCADDEQPLPALRTELMMARTDAQGIVTALLTDAGKSLQPTQPLRGWRADTTYRVMATYESIAASSQVAVRQLLQIPTAAPLVLQSGEMRTDAIRLLALWKSSTFVNLRFGIPKSYDGKHTVGWIFRSISQQPDGHRLLRLQLYHDAHNDRSDYDEEAYLSCQLNGFAQQLTAGRDSIVLSINTTQGHFTRTFPY